MSLPEGGAASVTRYDTQATFGAAASWATFDARPLNTAAEGIQTAAFDCRYIYVVPGHASGNAAFVVRYDTTAAFDSASS